MVKKLHEKKCAWHFFLVLVGIGTILSVGCTHTSELHPRIEVPDNVSKVPLRIGVYFDDNFRTYEYSKVGGSHRWAVPVGKTSVTLFQEVLPVIFEYVEIVSALPPYERNNLNLSAVLRPTIEEFDFNWPYMGFGAYSAHVTYRFTVHAMDGRPGSSWTVQGNGWRDWGWDYATHSTPIGEVSEQAMQEAAHDLMMDLRKIPQVKRWLRENSIE